LMGYVRLQSGKFLTALRAVSYVEIISAHRCVAE
jgi:hypothetical protein